MGLLALLLGARTLLAAVEIDVSVMLCTLLLSPSHPFLHCLKQFSATDKKLGEAKGPGHLDLLLAPPLQPPHPARVPIG